MSTNDFKADYDRDGFLLVRSLFGPDDVQAIRARFEAIWNDGVPGFFERQGESYINHVDSMSYPRIIHPHRFDALSRRILIEPRLAAILTDLLDDEPIAAQTMYYWKPPGTKGQALHQDNLYLQGNDGHGCIAAWIAIDTCDEENGCLTVVPGSHRLDLQCPEAANTEESFTGHFVPPPGGFESTPVLMNPGDCLFFGGHTIHGSGPNRSADRCRRSFICHYIGSRSTESAGFYNPLIRMNGKEFHNAAASMGSPCGVEFSGPH
ncbi:MAG: phytanoyl-CoA dioxygenase family protein [Fimbriimonadaceae bacterium]|nr:phytanoyl-CoA dioxygenase family protein [Fimbriimonadaceae bacterium]